MVVVVKMRVVVLAGQSNARKLSDQVEQALNAQYGAGNFVLVHAHSAGAPLMRARDDKSDWVSDTELRAQLADDTIAALTANPDAEFAGMIWMQGEGDTYATSDAAGYGAAFQTLYEDFTTRVETAMGSRDVGLDHAQVVISELSEQAPDAARRHNWDEVIRAHKYLAEDLDMVASVDPDAVAALHGITGSAMFEDGLHYSALFAQDLASALVNRLAQEQFRPPSTTEGSQGDDILGADGSATMRGGYGDDLYMVDARGDRVIEFAGEGADHVMASVTFSLRQHSQHLEDLTLTGTGDLKANGNGQNNTITGNAGDNVLNGATGDDVLIGGAGDDVFKDYRGGDRMVGGRGDDTYYVDNARDRIEESDGEGHDHVISEISLTLRFHSQYLEDLTLTGSQDLFGTGNGLNNVIRGNAGDNALNGAWGDDVLIGGAGRDTLRDDHGNDIMTGGSGADVFQFKNGFGRDVITDFNVDLAAERIDLSRVSAIVDWADLSQSHMHQSGEDTVISVGDAHRITLENVDMADLGAVDFIF